MEECAQKQEIQNKKVVRRLLSKKFSLFEEHDWQRLQCEQEESTEEEEMKEGSAGLLQKKNLKAHSMWGGVQILVNMKVRGCWIVVKRKGMNGQNTGSVMRRCRTWRKSNGRMRNWEKRRKHCQGCKRVTQMKFRDCIKQKNRSRVRRLPPKGPLELNKGNGRMSRVRHRSH